MHPEGERAPKLVKPPPTKCRTRTVLLPSGFSASAMAKCSCRARSHAQKALRRALQRMTRSAHFEVSRLSSGCFLNVASRRVYYVCSHWRLMRLASEAGKCYRTERGNRMSEECAYGTSAGLVFVVTVDVHHLHDCPSFCRHMLCHSTQDHIRRI